MGLRLLVFGLIVAIIIAVFPFSGYLGRRHMGRTWRPEIAGVFELLGAASIAFGLYWATLSPETIDIWIVSWALIPAAVLGVVGGIFGLRRKRWGLALAGAIALSIAWVGVPSLVLILLSKKEFLTGQG